MTSASGTGAPTLRETIAQAVHDMEQPAIRTWSPSLVADAIIAAMAERWVCIERGRAEQAVREELLNELAEAAYQAWQERPTYHPEFRPRLAAVLDRYRLRNAALAPDPAR